MTRFAVLLFAVLVTVAPAPAAAQGHEGHAGHGAQEDPHAMHMAGGSSHDMFMHTFASGWHLLGMGQVFPIWSRIETLNSEGSLTGSGLQLTQPVAMLNLESPDRRFALRFTPNFEFATLADGELTLGGWGEGFIDSRHPHTAVHELMLSVNSFGESVDWSLSAGKGFAPYGTEDPMSRPVLKYPTNHHLSQILERFTVNATVLVSGWSLEAGVFGGGEPEGPWDFSNVDTFGDSWSLRLARRFGAENAWGTWPWELAGSWAEIEEAHHGEAGTKSLANAQLRHDAAHSFGRLYGLVEASRVDAEGTEEDFWSVLAEARIERGAHQPYARVEWATRPEYPRDAAAGDEFFRYDHDAHVEGATRWALATLGYGYAARRGTVGIRPFVELQFARIANERDVASVRELFGDTRAWGVSVGARVFLGGDPMRMGTYGVLDPMTRMARQAHPAG